MSELSNIRVDDYNIQADISLNGNSDIGIVISHGANNDMENIYVKNLFYRLKEHYNVIRFNFSFVDKPENKNISINTNEIVACIGALNCKESILIGKSYGAKLSTHIAENDRAVRGVINLGYPLHKADDLSELSNEIKILRSVSDKALFIIGSEDPLFDVRAFKRLVPQARIIEIEGGDHSFKGKTDEESLSNLKRVIEAVTSKVDELVR
ncbi:hypothetical protein B2A_10640 [mine drainage metagenome]|uniref:KANL3/Tex30 alpha/beta hydrolase-like domain-containing protein n=2 Tax=mine drainage metagenome TaxID=410659 RepID=T1AL69_9ZZZZ